MRFLILAVALATVAPSVFGQALAPNARYIEKQLMCALDKAPCDSLGQQIKFALPEIIGRNCRSCDPRQAANVRRIARFVQSNYPDAWEELLDKYSD